MTNNRTINYSQCWEDTELLLNALNISHNDIVLSITSGGDNTIALLLKKPKKIESIDFNNAQNYLIELKLKSPKVLTIKQYFQLLGLSQENNRKALLQKTFPLLTPSAKEYWQSNYDLIHNGI